jgi:DNA-K related protein/Hsp70 protein
MPESSLLIGIDLGTSNCAVASVDPSLGREAPVIDFPVPQLERPAQVSALPLLPSCIYVPNPHELPPEATRLPWGDQPELVVGEYARWQGARVPGRLIFSAKSWLCHPNVDRSAAILPWGASPDVNKLSPIDASARLLDHISRAWDSAHPEARLANQEVIITVPASFDEVARSLTVSAARKAGLEKFTLVEEPQAAFYDFTARHRHDLARALEGLRLVLVVDVGGGTSDFTLVQVGVTPEGPIMRRIAVGEHLMLGGDNMDAALARRAEQRMLPGGRRLSAAQWSQLVQGARLAKETLLSERGPDISRLALGGEGSRLVGRSLSTQITRAQAEEAILDGFLPECRSDESPRRAGRVALQEMGLPYASDPAITRHLAAFLRTHAASGFAALGETSNVGVSPAPSSATSSSATAEEVRTDPDASIPKLPRPDAILLNGGVFKSKEIAQRLLRVASGWWPAAPPIPLLHHESLDLAVARGAAYYGLVRRGLGRRIGGGAAHALYLGLEKTGSEVPMALCVVPRGQEEAEAIDLGERVFQLALGKPVRFPLYSTSADRFDKSGEIVSAGEDMNPLAPIHALLKGAGGRTGNVPVHLRAMLTEIGTLELWCADSSSDERWRLEFELRGDQQEGALAVAESMPPAFGEARMWVEHIFGSKPRGAVSFKGTPPKDVKQLWSSLEKTLGPREQWRLPVLRELWSTLFAGASKRHRSADHERIFFQLLGYTLRPGVGYPLDEWRCEQSAKLFPQGIQFHKGKAVWNEFWIFLRRVAAGLSPARHQEIWDYLRPFLALRLPPHPPKNLPRPKGMQADGVDEMARLAASLEHLPPSAKAELGGWIILRLSDRDTAGGPWTWALGRLGARAPIFGSAHNALPPAQAAEWVGLLLQPHLRKLEGALFALAQLSRLTGDRLRDLDEATRLKVRETLQAENAPPQWRRLLTEVVELEATDKARALGDTLPLGLSLAEPMARPANLGANP